MQQWEYLTYFFGLEGLGDVVDEERLDAKLNEFGSEGWELVTVQPVNAKMSDAMLLYIFKRPRF